MGERTGVVYLLRDKSSDKPFYIGSTIRPFKRKSDHITQYRTNNSIREYTHRNNIEYTFEVIETVIGIRSEVMKKIRNLEQRYILKCKHPLLNKQSPLKHISKYKKKYPWLTNIYLLKTIIK